MRTLLDGLREHAVKESISLLGLKDVSDLDNRMFESIFAGSGFARMANVPVTYVEVPYQDEEAYLATLPGKTASYLRRKLRTLTRTKVEYRDSVAGLEEQLHALHQATRAKSQVQ